MAHDLQIEGNHKNEMGGIYGAASHCSVSSVHGEPYGCRALSSLCCYYVACPIGGRHPSRKPWMNEGMHVSEQRASKSCHCIQVFIPPQTRVLHMLKTSWHLYAKQEISSRKINPLPGTNPWVCFYHNQQMEILGPHVKLARLGVIHIPAIHSPSGRWRFSVLFHHLRRLLQKAGN